MFKISWKKVMSLSAKLVHPGPQTSRARAHAATKVVSEVGPVVTEMLRDLTALPATVVDNLEVVPLDRPRWIYCAGRTLSNLVQKAPGNAVSEETVSPLKGLAMSTVMGIFATRAHSHCDPTAQGEPIYVVVPNLVATRRRKSLDMLDFTQWVVLRTALYCVQFRAAPWLVDYMRQQIMQVMAAAAADEIADLSLWNLWSVVRSLDSVADLTRDETVDPIRRTSQARGYTHRPVTQSKTVADTASSTPDSADLVAALTELNLVLEIMSAYVRVCMETVTPLEISSIQRIRVAMRLIPSPLELATRGFTRALGSNPRKQTVNATSFFRSVRLWGGMEAVNQIFAGPEFFPSGAELDDPTLWWERIHNNPL